MKKNMGSTDRIIRLIIAALIAILYLTEVLSGTLGTVLLILAGIFLITSIFRYCPFYVPFGLNTLSAKEQKKQ